MIFDIVDDEYGVCISNPNYFLAVSDFNISNKMGMVENITVLKDENNLERVAFDDLNIIKRSSFHDYYINSYDYIHIITFVENDVVNDDFTDSLKVLNSPKGFADARINISQILIIDKVLFSPDLKKLFKLVSTTKAKLIANMNLSIHIENILNKDDFLIVLCDLGSDNVDYVAFDMIKDKVQEAFEISLEDAFEKLKLKSGILDYLVGQGILIGDLVESGLDLLDCEITSDLEDKMEAQILKALSDVNVISLIIAGMRLKDDVVAKNIRELCDDSSLYSGEVLGIAIANQIAGTKATLNFKHYSQEKPGIIYGLPYILDDIFAGLIAGCVSKIFEE